MLLYSYLMRDSQHSNDPVEATIYATSKCAARDKRLPASS